jgi:modulator of FtsH protease HflK
MTEKANDETPSARLIRAGFAWAHGRLNWKLWTTLALLALLYNCHYRVEIGETAARRFFGRVVATEIQPGLRWRLPFGIHQIDIRATEEIKRLEIDAQISPDLPMMTGDINFANARLVVQFRVSNLKDYLFQHEHPETALQDIVRGNFIDTIGSMFIDMVLATEKRFVEETVLEQSREQVAIDRLGIELTSVTLLSIEPPAEAVPAFRAVNDAKLNKQTLVNDTHKRVESLLARARGDAQRVHEDSLASARGRVLQSAADASRFEDLLVAKRANPQQTQVTEYWDTMRKVMADARVVLLNPDQKPNLAVNLIESPRAMPLNLAGISKHDSGASGKKGAQTARHPTAAPMHAADERRTTDRKPGVGAHKIEAEAHSFPVPTLGKNIPPHDMDGKGKSASPSAGAKQK